MTSFAEAREAAYQHWFDSAPSGLDAWTFEGEHFEEPDQGKKWARFSFQQINGGQQTLGQSGNRKYRRRAIASIQIFTPRGEGLRNGDLLADEVVIAFESVSVSGLDFTNATVRETPPGPSDKFRQHLVTVDCTFYEVR